MQTSIEVLFTPADFAALAERDLGQTWCVVFDVLRATSSMVTALAGGAEAVIPLADISEALAFRSTHPQALLAGERNGLRITGTLTGGVEFDLGNSPREFTPERIRGKIIVMTTTNGTRALRACARAQRVLAASFLNLSATAREVRSHRPPNLLLVCSGTLEQAAYEDALGAGALCDLVWADYAGGMIMDSALMALRLYRLESANLEAALASSRNGRRLSAQAALQPDVPFCAQRDRFPLVARLGPDGAIRTGG
jgi:2-phosphosulfolactate phosphatase